METDQILDLFNLSDTTDMPAPKDGAVEDNAEGAIDEATGEVREKGKKGWLDDLGELWDDKVYEEEFALEGFLKSMQA